MTTTDTNPLSTDRILALRWRVSGIYAEFDKTTRAMIANPYNADKVERLEQNLRAHAEDLVTLSALIELATAAIEVTK